MSSKRQKIQSQQVLMLLAFAQESRSESPMARDEGTVLPAADPCTESPTRSLTSRTAVVRTRMPGGVGGREPQGSPLSRSTRLAEWVKDHGLASVAGHRRLWMQDRECEAVDTPPPSWRSAPGAS